MTGCGGCRAATKEDGRGFGQCSHGLLANLAVVFPHAQFVKLEVLEAGETGESQTASAALQGTAVNHQERRRAPEGGQNGLHPPANASETTHIGDTQLLQTPGRVIG